jgi:hypothetical protein
MLTFLKDIIPLDDYVDFFEGYYPINYPWKPGQEMIEEGYDCKLVFTML